MGKKDRPIDRATYNVFLQGINVVEGDKVLLTLDRPMELDQVQQIHTALTEAFPNTQFVVLEGMRVAKIERQSEEVLAEEGDGSKIVRDQDGAVKRVEL